MQFDSPPGATTVTLRGVWTGPERLGTTISAAAFLLTLTLWLASKRHDPAA